MQTEFELIKEIKKGMPYSKDVIKGIGDDCAIIKKGKIFQLYTIDNMVEGVHFDTSFKTTYKNIGFKAVSRAVSDIAAMGGRPLYILVSLAMSEKLDNAGFKSILKGIKSACKLYNIDIIGGDITKSATITITVSVVGESNTKPVLRSGAMTGDDIYVTGELGLARAGLELLKTRKRANKKLIAAYERPAARIELGYTLREKGIATSMIDISDGLLGDLRHILEESKKGALLDIKNIPVPDILLRNFPQSTSLDFVLNGGDDYELLFTAKKGQNDKIAEISKHFKIPITKIGTITKSDFLIVDGTKKTKVTSYSYEHKFVKE